MIVAKLAIAGMMLVGLSACAQTRLGLQTAPVKAYAFQAAPQSGFAKGTALALPRYASATTLSFSDARRPQDAPVSVHLKQHGIATMAEIPLARTEDTSLNLTAGRRSERDWLGGVSFNWSF